MSKFENQLNEYNLNTTIYLNVAKIIAKKRGYDPKKLSLANDNIHKLDYDGVKFGRVGYKDKLIYAWLESNGLVPQGTMRQKYTNYRKRAKEVMKNTKNKFSPASLSYYIIW